MKRVRVVAAFCERDGKVLVQQRPQGKARAGLWEFPGGKVEPGEADAAALVRECDEELGVKVAVGRELWRVEHAYDDLVVELVLMRAEIDRALEPEARDAGALAWVPRERLAELPFCAADVPLVEALARGETLAG